jgi:hypothetical protein
MVYARAVLAQLSAGRFVALRLHIIAESTDRSPPRSPMNPILLVLFSAGTLASTGLGAIAVAFFTG